MFNYFAHEKNTQDKEKIDKNREKHQQYTKITKSKNPPAIFLI